MCNKMSDVRLSNASPTLERGVDARQQDNLRPPVRRNLFGRPDPAEIRRNLDALVQEDVQVLRERYNFDPESDRPLSPRNYEWQEDRDAPEFYRRPPHVNQPPRREGDLADRTPRRDAAEEASGRRSGQDRQGSRKRRLGPSGPCSAELQRKRSRSDEEEDDDDQSKDTGSQAVKADQEDGGGRPEHSAEVQ